MPHNIILLVFFSFFIPCFAKVKYETHKITIAKESFNAYVFSPSGKKDLKTLVFLPSYTYPLCLPDDFSDLINELKEEFQIIVIEYYGYGASEDTQRPRTSKNICYEIHRALKKLDVKSYILVPHSISGLYALSYIDNYPEEVEAIIGIDMTLPCYNLEAFASNGEYKKYPFRDSSKVTKAFANMHKYFWLTSKELENFSLPEKLPALFFLSSELEEYMDSEIKAGVYKTTPLIYLHSICNGDNQRIIQMEGTHYLYRTRHEDMAKEIKDFTKRIAKNKKSRIIL